MVMIIAVISFNYNMLVIIFNRIFKDLQGNYSLVVLIFNFLNI